MHHSSALILRLFCAGLLWLFCAPAAAQVDLYVGPQCGQCRIAQRVLQTAGIDARVHHLDQPQVRAQLTERFGSNVERRLPIVRAGEHWLLDDPSLAQIRAHLDDPPEVWRATAPDQARIQWFDRAPPSPACAAHRRALEAAGFHLELNDIQQPAIEERMWVTARLLDHHGRSGLSLPVVVVNHRLLIGCPDPGELALLLGSASLWQWAEREWLEDPQASAQRVLGLINVWRVFPRKALSQWAQALPEEAALSTQLAYLRTQQPHLLSATPPTMGASPRPPDLQWRAAPSSASVLAQLLRSAPQESLQLLTGSAQVVYIEVEADPVLGLQIQLWYGPAPGAPHGSRPEPSAPSQVAP